MALTATSFMNAQNGSVAKKRTGASFLGQNERANLSYGVRPSAVNAYGSQKQNRGGFFGGLGYLGEKFAVGLTSSLEGILDYSAAGFAKLFGADDWAEQVIANDWFGDWYSHPEEWYNPSKGWQTAGDVAGGIGTSLPSTLAAIGAVAIAAGTGGTGAPLSAGILSAIGGGSAATVGGLGAAGNATKQAYRETGQLTGKEFGYGALSGVTEGSLEGITNALSLGTGTIIKSAARSLGKETAKTVAKEGVLKSLGKAFGGEALEEGLSEMIDPVWQRMTYNPEAQNATPQEIAYAAFIGGISGLVMDGSKHVYSAGKSLIKGNNLVKNGKESGVIDSAKQITEWSERNPTEDNTFEPISSAYTELIKRLEETGGSITTPHQIKLLGDLSRHNVSASVNMFVANRALGVVNNADVIAKRLTEYGYKTKDGKPITYTAEQLREGFDPQKPSSIYKALKTNDALRELAIADATGHLMMDYKKFAYATMTGQRLASQVDINRFMANASQSEIDAVSQSLGIEDWNTLDVETFNQKIADFVESGGVQAYAARRAMVQDFQAIPSESARPMIKMVNMRQDGTVRYADGNADIAITKNGDAYTVYDYTTNDLTKNITRSEVNTLLREYNTNKETIAAMAKANAQARVDAETEFQRQDAEIDTYARENISDYTKLNDPNQGMIRKVIREGRAKGMTDEDVLAYAKISAHAGIDITFDKQATFRGHDEEGNERYADGFYDPKTNRIVVNPDSKRTHERLLIHELDHAIRQFLGADGVRHAKVFRQALEGVSPEVAQRIARAYQGVDSSVSKLELAMDETNAYFAEEVLSNRHTLEKLIEAEPTLKDKILSFFKGASKDYASVPKLSKAARQYYKTYKKLFDEFSEWNFQNNATESSAKKAVTRTNHENVQVTDHEVRYSLIGRTEDGRGIYRSNYPKNTPKIQKQKDIINLVQNIWSKKPIRLNLVVDGKNVPIEANFNPELAERSDLAKIAFGNRKGTNSEKRITLDLSSDLYQIAEESHHVGSKIETGKENPAHFGVSEWHYFLTNLVFVEDDGTKIDCYMNIDVKQNDIGHWFYSFAIEKGTAPQTLLAGVTEESATVPNNSITDPAENVNRNSENSSDETRQSEAETVAQDVLAGKKANEVSYGRQDIDAEGIQKGRKINREHGRRFAIPLDETSEENYRNLVKEINDENTVREGQGAFSSEELGRLEKVFGADVVADPEDRLLYERAVKLANGITSETIPDNTPITVKVVNPKFYTKEMLRTVAANENIGYQTKFFVERMRLSDTLEYRVEGLADTDAKIAYVKASSPNESHSIIYKRGYTEKLAEFSAGDSSVSSISRHERLHLLLNDWLYEYSTSKTVLDAADDLRTFVEDERGKYVNTFDAINYWYQKHRAVEDYRFTDYAQEVACDLYAGALKVSDPTIQAEIDKLVGAIDDAIEGSNVDGVRYALDDSEVDNRSEKEYNYTKEQYNSFGWAREAEAITKNELDDLYAKIHGKSTLRAFRRTWRGESVVEVNNDPHANLAVDNVFAFVTGSKKNFSISRVVRFDAEIEIEMEIFREVLYENRAFSDTHLAFLEQKGFATQYTREGAKTFDEYKRLRESGESSRGANQSNRGREKHGSGYRQDSGTDGEVTSSSAHRRFALDLDSEGTQLTEAQQEFLKDSKVRDTKGKALTPEQQKFFADSAIKAVQDDGSLRISPDGALMPVYHGTNNGEFYEFDKNCSGSSDDAGWYGKGFYFAFRKGEAEYYGRRVLECYLNIKNPFVFDDEMQAYDGVTSGDILFDFASFVLNMAEKFPDIAKKLTVEVAEHSYGDSSEVAEKNFVDLAAELKEIYDSKRLSVVEVHDDVRGDHYEYRIDNDVENMNIPANLKKVIQEQYINSASWAEYLHKEGEISREQYEDILDAMAKYGERNFETVYLHSRFETRKRAEAHRLSAALQYLSEKKYSYLEQHIPEHFMTRIGNEFSAEIQRRGYDGVLQSLYGDEVVAFDANQIKLTSNTAPTSDPDIRYALSETRESIMTEVDPEYKPNIKDKAFSGWTASQIAFTNAQAGIETIGKQYGVKNIESLVQAARSGRNQAEEMIAGNQYRIGADTKTYQGEGLEAIFRPISRQGEEVKGDFFDYLFNYHNMSRMTLEQRSMAEQQTRLDDLKKKVSALKRLNKRIEKLQEQIKALGRTKKGMETKRGLREELARAKAEAKTLKKEATELEKAAKAFVPLENKPVLGTTDEHGIETVVTAEQSEAIVKKYEEAHPEFKGVAEKVWAFLQNLNQYRVDTGLISQDTFDYLAKLYPHYVPTYRTGATKGIGAIEGKYNLKVKTTIKTAKGSTKNLLPPDVMIARQVMETVRTGRINQLANALYEGAQKSGDTTYIEIVSRERMSDEAIADLDPTELRPKNNEVAFFRDGERITMRVSKEIFAGFNAFNPEVEIHNPLVNGARAINNGFKRLVTSLNPAFLLRNTIRDVQDAGINTRYGKTFLKNYARATYEISHDGKLWQLYKAMGGFSSSVFDFEKGFSGMQNKWGLTKPEGNLLQQTLQGVENANAFVEQLPRLAEFISSIEAGNTAEQAILDSADVTTNFARMGNITKVLNRTLIPFLNPSIQGCSKMIRNITSIRSAREFASLALKAALVGIAPMVLNMLMYEDDEDYKNLRDADKENNFLFKVGDTFVKIPRGRVASVIGGLVNRSKTTIEGEDADWAGYMKNVAQQVTPVDSMSRTIFSPFADVSNNITWYGSAIEGRQFENTAPKDRYDESTSSIAIAIGKAINYSPKKIHYLLDQYSGVIGDFILPATTAKAEKDFLSGNFTLDPATSNKLSAEFYEMYDQAQYAKTTGDDTATYQVRYLNKVKSAISDMYKQKSEIQNNPELSNADKLQQSRVVQLLINEAYKTALQDFELYTKAIEATAGMEDENLRFTEATRLMYGAERALSEYNDDVYAKSQALAKAGIDYEVFYNYYFTVRDIVSDKDRNGNTVSGSKRKKVVASIKSMKISADQKLLLICASGYAPQDNDLPRVSAETAKKRLLRYILGLKGATKEEKAALAEMCGFEVKNGRIVTKTVSQ